MIVLDTHVLVNDAMNPGLLSRRARAAIADGQAANFLCCSDMSLWEIAMLIARKRLRVDADAGKFLEGVLAARAIRVLPITVQIAVLAQSDNFVHGDPADRVIAASALAHGAQLITADKRLRKVPGLKVIW